MKRMEDGEIVMLIFVIAAFIVGMIWMITSFATKKPAYRDGSFPSIYGNAVKIQDLIDRVEVLERNAK